MKYHNRKTAGYDSRKEARRAQELHLMQAAGHVAELREQVRYELIPAQYEPDVITATGKHKRGRCIERACYYVADFVYIDEDGVEVVEDTKGIKTKDYIIKRKLMLERYGVRIKET